MTIDALCEQYEAWARTQYRKPSGKLTSTVEAIHYAVRELRQTPHPSVDRVGLLTLEEFQTTAPRLLQDCIQHMMGTSQLAPRSINVRLMWIRAMFLWAGNLELIDEMVSWRLSRVKNLRCAKSKPKAVSWEAVAATMAVASLKMATMIEVEWWTGMRPIELCYMNRTSLEYPKHGDWVYHVPPDANKLYRRDEDRLVQIGSGARTLLSQWLARSDVGEWLFEGGTLGHRNNKPMTVTGYRNNIYHLCKLAGIPKWHPHQLRHAAGKRIRKAGGLDAAQAQLGHASRSTTETFYAALDEQKAREVADRYG